MKKRMLLISNSTNAGEEYLAHCINNIREFLGEQIRKVLFIPYAGVSISFDEYTSKVAEHFYKTGYETDPVHKYNDPVQAVRNAEAIAVGGGNTFNLVHLLHKNKLIDIIREKVNNGIPYIGWSAGSNVVCPTLKTTNDMPIVEPESFNTLDLVPFQINPHYLDAHPEGHAGETREMRIEEFIIANPDVSVMGLREGTMLRIEGDKMRLIGSRKMRLFKQGMQPHEYDSDAELDFLLK
ncbi:MAG: dipeptidase PepE [Bacteroidota bacterium]